MTVTYTSIGALNAGDTSVTLAYPSAPSGGEVAVAVVESGHPTAATMPSTPDGWALIGTRVGTSGTYGADAGPRRLSFYIRVTEGGESNPTWTIAAGTDSRIGGAIAFCAKSQTLLRYALSTGEDTSSGTGFSITGASTIAFAANDLMILGYVIPTDAVNFTAEAITAAGITFGTITERADGGSNTGADAGRAVATGSVSSGTATVAPTVTSTLTGASIGVAGALRLRDAATDTGPGSITLTFDTTLSRIEIDASGLDANGTTALVQRSLNEITWTTVRGASEIGVTGGAFDLPAHDYEFVPNVANYYRVTASNAGNVTTDTEVDTITPTQTAVWLKSVPRPFLNIETRPLGLTFAYERTDRGGLFPVVGRSLPVAVSEVRGSRRYPVRVRTDTEVAATDLDLLLASGDILYLQAPTTSVLPSGGVFLVASQVVVEAPNPLTELRLTNFIATEVAAPGADVVGATSTWQTVLSNYTSWTTLIAGEATWADVLQLVGDASEVITP